MKRILRLATILAVVLGAVSYASPAAASTPVSCSTRVNAFLDDTVNVGWLDVVGTHVTARGSLGFSTFTMQDGYQVETHPLHTPGSATRRLFYALRNSTTHFTGFFHVVFTDRGNGDEDRSQLWIGRGGVFWLQSITWGGGWKQLQSPVCYAGPGGQLVVTGHIDNPGFGTDFWTFVMQGAQLW